MIELGTVVGPLFAVNNFPKISHKKFFPVKDNAYIYLNQSTMTKKKSIKKFIEKSEQSLAARYFTLSNTAMLHMVQGGDLDYGYDREIGRAHV